jgi:hypothetical protein
VSSKYAYSLLEHSGNLDAISRPARNGTIVDVH